MLARALLVVLIVLNLGVALWWIARPAHAPASPPTSDRGGAALQLAPRAADDAPPTPAPSGPAADPPAAPLATAAPVQCLRLGPFTARNVAEAMRAELGTVLQRSAIEEAPGDAASYRVLLPAVADRGQAQATAARIAAAGFDDYMILSQGEEANAIALGAFRSREAAERRVASLQAAGFPAQLRAQGSAAPSRWWLDVATADAAAVRARVPRTQDRDCARLR